MKAELVLFIGENVTRGGERSAGGPPAPCYQDGRVGMASTALTLRRPRHACRCATSSPRPPHSYQTPLKVPPPVLLLFLLLPLILLQAFPLNRLYTASRPPVLHAGFFATSASLFRSAPPCRCSRVSPAA
ncbi:hypothetical protein E2C01_077861 [Portunus trituberculatus]|uniref:Uncharacterized protein n=1 Tax=Portunus trituberculatus TaxID=210409 RepID=A0A5B7ILC9_PORTR|nr:hypothetical protein [Portunus trituberculatus]